MDDWETNEEVSIGVSTQIDAIKIMDYSLQNT